MTEALATANSILLHSWSFFFRHYPIVFAFGIFASAQRFLAVGDFDLPLVDGLVGELFTMAVRVAFVVWVVRAALRHRLDLSTEHSTIGVVLVSTGYLLLLTLVFKLGLDTVGGQLVPEAHQSTYFSWELAIKNLTVIPFTIVWMVVLAVALVGGSRDTADEDDSAQTAPLNAPSASSLDRSTEH